MARSPRHPTVTAIRLMAMAVMAIQLMAMVMAVMATRLTAMAMEPVTATRPMAMGLGTATRLTAIAPVITGVTEPPITPLFDTVSMRPLPVSIVIDIGTNAGRVRALELASRMAGRR